MRQRWCFLVTLAACSSSGEGGPAPEPPDSCSAGRLTYVDNIRIGKHALGAGDHSIQAYTFTPGDHPTLDLDDGTDERIFIEGEEPLVPGDSVASRGYVKFQRNIGNEDVPYNFGNCETGAFSGTLTLSLDGTTWQFTIEDMHKPPYCSGDSIRGGFAGCFKKPAP
jgi:hypothetical protein